MRHVFKGTRMGWDKIKEGIWFDANEYTEEEAKAEFKPFHGLTQRGYSYTGYEYGGKKYHDVTYLGIYEDDDMPMDDIDVWDSILEKRKG